MFKEPDEDTAIYISPYDRKPKGRPRKYTDEEISVIRNEIAKTYYQENLNHCKEIQKSYYQKNKEIILELRKLNRVKNNQNQVVVN